MQLDPAFYLPTPGTLVGRINQAIRHFKLAWDQPEGAACYLEVACRTVHQLGPLRNNVAPDLLVLMMTRLEMGEETANRYLAGIAPEEIRIGFNALKCLMVHRDETGDRFEALRPDCFRTAALPLTLKLRNASSALLSPNTPPVDDRPTAAPARTQATVPAAPPLFYVFDQPAKPGRGHPVQRRIDLVVEALQRFTDGEHRRQDIIAAMNGVLEIQTSHRRQLAKVQGMRAVFLLGHANGCYHSAFGISAEDEFSCAAKILGACMSNGSMTAAEAAAARKFVLAFVETLSVAIVPTPGNPAFEQAARHAD